MFICRKSLHAGYITGKGLFEALSKLTEVSLPAIGRTRVKFSKHLKRVVNERRYFSINIYVSVATQDWQLGIFYKSDRPKEETDEFLFKDDILYDTSDIYVGNVHSSDAKDDVFIMSVSCVRDALSAIISPFLIHS